MKILKFSIISILLIGTNISAQSIYNQIQDNASAKGLKPEELISSIVFSYDEAGNQIYRGYNITVTHSEPKGIGAGGLVSNTDQFWLGINIYPVPVKSTLTIAWNEDNNSLIDNITLYQHSTMSFLLKQQNIPNLNRQVQINMVGYYPGVYVLNFQLKDGRILSRNILKE